VILDGLARRGVRSPIVYASSLRVYGSPLPSIVDEQAPLGVFSDLAHLSKCYAEKLLEMYAAVRGLAGRVVRLALTYGVAPVLKTDPRFMTAPNLFCLRAARGEPVEIRTPDSLALIHADDAARALLLAAEGVPGTGFAVFNAAGETASLRDVAACLQQVIAERAIDVDLAVRDLTDGRPAGPVPAVRSALHSYGFRPTRRLAEGLAETFDHFWVHGR
jgi:nucleoside-diphosphate-sugar epimerase